jgi:hypothetical protein
MKHGRGSGRLAFPLGKVPIFVMAAVAVAGIGALIAHLMLAAQQAPRSATPPDSDSVTILVRTTVVAVHQANITGNYTVLRDLAAPAVQEKNSTADLALTFASLRQQKLDLAPVVLLEPTLTAKPVIDQQNILRLAGTLTPVPIAFDLAFHNASGSWRWSRIAIKPVPQPVAPPPSAPPSAAVQDRFPER